MDSKNRITEMSDEEFDFVIEAYIERESHEIGEIDAVLFYEALEEIFAAEPATETVELEVELSAPNSTSSLRPARLAFQDSSPITTRSTSIKE